MPLRKNAKIELIKSVPLFSSCSKKELAAIAAQADELVVPEGKTLTKQGDRGREFMVIVDGSAEVRKNGRKMASDWVHIFTFRGGKVVQFREFLDTAVAAAAYRG